MDGHFRACDGTGTCFCDVKRYWLVFGLAVVIFSGEIVGGILSGSLALFSDAGHVLTDLVAVVVAIVVESSVVRNPIQEGRYRGLGAFINGALLIIVAALIALEAFERMLVRREILTGTMIGVAIFGAFGNYLQHRVLGASHSRHLTHQGMSLHVLSDFWQSIAVIAAGVLIAATGHHIFDLVASGLIASLMLLWGIRLILLGRLSYDRATGHEP